MLSSAQGDLCTLCPRTCKVERSRTRGLCGTSATLRLARAALHQWEEPPLSGTNGSGTIFFSGCSLRCVFCQNHRISQGLDGQDITEDRLIEIMFELENQGAHNINFVTGTHFIPQIIRTVKLAQQQGLTLPIVWNTSGYETIESVRALSEVVDIWLWDAKYASTDLAMRFSHAADYPEKCFQALDVLVSEILQGEKPVYYGDLMAQGLIVRHLILPGHTHDSCEVLERLWELYGRYRFELALMNQYTPNEICRSDISSELSRTLESCEYERVLQYAYDLGFEQIWWQEEGTATESFIPAFDYTGVVK